MMEIKKMSLDKLNPAKYNPRKELKPGDPEFEKLKRSIQEFGLVEPIILNKRTGNVVGGHQRLSVLKHLGYSETDCVIVDLDDAKEKTLNIALNKISGQWDDELLSALLKDIEKSGFDVSLTGFDAAEIESMFDDEDSIIEDEPPEPDEEKPFVQAGDIWLLGRHRLLCGDSTNYESVLKLTEGKEIDLCVTDPPYNVNYESGGQTIQNDNMGEEDFKAFLTKAFTCINKVLKPGGAFYIWHAETPSGAFRQACNNALGRVRQVLIWNKNAFTLGRSDYQNKYEPCIYGWKDGASHYFIDDRTQATVYEDKGIDLKKLKKEEMLKLLQEIFSDKVSTDVINEDKPTKSSEHPTMKPVRLIARLIKNSSKPDETVIDTFGGSGSTLIACEQLGRTCYTMEIDPKYAEVIVKRYLNFVKKDEAEVIRNGRKMKQKVL